MKFKIEYKLYCNDCDMLTTISELAEKKKCFFCGSKNVEVEEIKKRIDS